MGRGCYRFLKIVGVNVALSVVLIISPIKVIFEGWSMVKLMSFEETMERYEGGENAFDLAIEKWVRIKEAIKTAYSLQHFVLIVRGASIKIALCVEFNDNCHLCPLEGICSREKEGLFSKVIRVMQAYCVAGDILPKSTLLDLVDQLISELQQIKEDFMKLRH
ncbi:MAG: hypothetical protein DRG50_00245 [Deltaproteobacteria bacterium]|nr:MAG: hypothetical protein DRG50_00245 [Deltaproteobacteria bacterium]